MAMTCKHGIANINNIDCHLCFLEANGKCKHGWMIKYCHECMSNEILDMIGCVPSCKHGISKPLGCLACDKEKEMSGCVPSLTKVDPTLNKKEMIEYILRLEKQIVIMQQMMNVIKEEILK